MRNATLLGLSLVIAACGADPTPSPKPPCPDAPPTSVSAQASLSDAELATFAISGAVEGEFVVELNAEEAPIATASFVELSRCGFYDGVKFHRVLAGFVIQAGDPKTVQHDGDFEGIGTGDPNYQFEIEPPAEGLGYDQYSVSMANNTQMNGTQFFVALSDLNAGLPRTYTIFGQVVSGTDTVDAIAAVPVNDPRIGVPASPVTIDEIVISAASEASPDE